MRNTFGFLPLDVHGAHVDDAFQAEARAQRCRRDAVLARAVSAMMRFFPMRRARRNLAQHVVHLVRAGVVQLVALQVDLGPAAVLCEPFGEIQRARPSHIVGEILAHLLVEGGDRPSPRRRRPRARGSAASASRRRNARRRCRNGRFRPDQCGRSSGLDGHGCNPRKRPVMPGSGDVCSPGGPLRTWRASAAARGGLDEGDDAGRILDARCPLHPG